MPAFTLGRPRHFAGPYLCFPLSDRGHNAMTIARCSGCDAAIDLSYDSDNAKVYLTHRGQLCAGWDRAGELRVAKVGR